MKQREDIIPSSSASSGRKEHEFGIISEELGVASVDCE
jgi:hypothetical protein